MLHWQYVGTQSNSLSKTSETAICFETCGHMILSMFQTFVGCHLVNMMDLGSYIGMTVGEKCKCRVVDCDLIFNQLRMTV